MQASVALELEDVSSSVDGGYFKVQDNSIVLSEEVRAWLQMDGGGEANDVEEGLTEVRSGEEQIDE